MYANEKWQNQQEVERGRQEVRLLWRDVPDRKCLKTPGIGLCGYQQKTGLSFQPQRTGG